MKISIETKDELKIITLHEKYINTSVATKLKSHFVDLIEVKKCYYLVLDLTKVETLDESIGINTLLFAHRQTEHHDGFTIIICANLRIIDMIAMAGLNDQLHIYPTLKAALKNIESVDTPEDAISKEIRDEFELDIHDGAVDDVFNDEFDDEDELKGFDSELDIEFDDDDLLMDANDDDGDKPKKKKSELKKQKSPTKKASTKKKK